MAEMIMNESRRRLMEEDPIADEERRQRRRRYGGWTEEELDEDDRQRAESRLQTLEAYRQLDEVNAREREEEEERKRWDPASRKAMLAMPLPVVGETREQDCAICLEEFVDGGKKLRMMPCSHSFHQRCIFEWLQRGRRCPICRYELPSVREDYLLYQQQQAAASVS
jgi:hypothetical protein